MANKMNSKFEKVGVKLIALSCDTVEDHKGWIKDIEGVNKGEAFTFPIIEDKDRTLATQLGMLDPDEKDAKGMPLTCRAVFIIGPGRKLKLSMLYPATTGRNFDEIYRVVQSLQLTVNYKVATPANWNSGGQCMVVPSVKKEELPKLFPKGVQVETVASGKEYLRYTPDPSCSAAQQEKK